MDHIKPTIVIPAYKPSPSLTEFIDSLCASCACRVVVVDDGSGPSYEFIFEEIEARGNATVLRHLGNQGKGAALKTAFRFVLQNDQQPAGVITADADGQHLVEDIQRVRQAFENKPSALFLGVRTFKTGVPLRSLVGNVMTRAIFQLVSGSRVSDTQTGLRAIPTGFLRELIGKTANGYEFESEMLLAAVTKGIPILEQEIDTVYIDGNRSSHFRPLIDSAKVWYTLFRFVGSSLLASGLDIGAFYLTYRLTSNIGVSMIAGRGIAILLNFMINRSVVFGYGDSWALAFARYLTLVALLAFAAYLGIILVIAAANVPALAAKLMVEILLFTVSFYVQRHFVFRTRGGPHV
jgi:glycosyltransferase involved in cell wall biosynthesis